MDHAEYLRKTEYLRRNNLVAKAAGARANVEHILSRLSHLQNRPKWLVRELEGVLWRIEPLSAELAAHRDESPKPTF